MWHSTRVQLVTALVQHDDHPRWVLTVTHSMVSSSSMLQLPWTAHVIIHANVALEVLQCVQSERHVLLLSWEQLLLPEYRYPAYVPFCAERFDRCHVGCQGLL